MPVIADLPTTNGSLVYSFPERGRQGVLTELVPVTANTSYLTLKKQLPARCRVLMSSLKMTTAVSLQASDASGTSVLCDTIALCNTLPTTNATSTTTTMVMAVSGAGVTSTSTNASRTIAQGTAETSAVFFAGEQLTAANAYATGTGDTTLYLVPMDTGGSEDFSVLTTPTNGYHFDSTGYVEVNVWFEQYTTPGNL